MGPMGSGFQCAGCLGVLSAWMEWRSAAGCAFDRGSASEDLVVRTVVADPNGSTRHRFPVTAIARSGLVRNAGEAHRSKKNPVPGRGGTEPPLPLAGGPSR